MKFLGGAQPRMVLLCTATCHIIMYEIFRGGAAQDGTVMYSYMSHNNVFATITNNSQHCVFCILNCQNKQKRLDRLQTLKLLRKFWCNYACHGYTRAGLKPMPKLAIP